MQLSLSLDKSIAWYITGMLIITILTGIVNIPYITPVLIGIGGICYSFRLLSLRKDEIIDSVTMFLLFFIAVLSAAINYGGYGTAINCIYGILIVSLCRRIMFTKVQVLCILFFCFISYVYWMIQSPNAYDVFMDAQRWDSSYDGVMNSNGVGTLIFYTSALFFSFSKMINNKYLNYIAWFMLLGATWGIYNAKSRMVLFSAILFIFILLVFQIKSLKINKVSILRRLLFLGIACEIIFPFLYLFLYQIGFASDYAFADTNEKGLYSGRQQIWGLALDSIDSFSDWLIGIGSYHDFFEGHDTLNMHNNFMNLLVVTGVTGVVIYYSYIVESLNKKIHNGLFSEFQYLMLLFFVCIIFNGISEVSLFYMGFAPFVFIPFGMALNSKMGKFDF